MIIIDDIEKKPSGPISKYQMAEKNITLATNK